MIKNINLLFIPLLLIMLSGCGEREDDIQGYMEEVKNRPAEPVDELPDMSLVGPYLYGAANLRSPFAAPIREESLIAGDVMLEEERPKEVLESFPLDSLRMVGTIEKNRTRWAILLDAEGLIYRATKGDRLGQNHGKVIEVSEKGLELLEIIPDARGGWREREAKLDLRMK